LEEFCHEGNFGQGKLLCGGADGDDTLTLSLNYKSANYTLETLLKKKVLKMMNFTETFYKLSLSLFILTVVGLFIPLTAFGQTEKLGIVQYAPLKGWTKTPKENVVAFSEINQKTGGFCIITVYGATPGAGSPTADFTREWKNLVMTNLKAEASPKTETQTADGWTMTAGGAAVEMEGGKALAFLSVFSGSGKTVSVLGVFNEPSYADQLDALVASIKIDDTVAPANDTAASAPAAVDADGNVVIPQPTRQLTLADFAGVWTDAPARVSTAYVFRSTGAHAGTDSLHYKNTKTIGSDGAYTNDFFAVRNGKKERDITTGTFSITGRLISIKEKNTTTKWVVRGWLETPTMTILKITGPWYDNAEIPERMFNDFGEDSRFIPTEKWVRMK